MSFWDDKPIAGPFADYEESRRVLDERNATYPGAWKLIPMHFPNKTVLDYGCGPGHDTIMFLENGAKHVYAVDIAPKSLKMVSDRVRMHHIDPSRLTTILVKETGVPLLPEVDHVHAAGVLHHCEDPLSVLKGLRKAMGTGLAMIYSKHGTHFSVTCGGDMELFASQSDRREDGTGAPIVVCWSDREFKELCKEAKIKATKLGHYRAETEGPIGTSACFRLEPL